jgi:TM2 domain-containing membrane protein YozV
MYCCKCGKEVVEGAAFCGVCGAPVQAGVVCVNPNAKSKIAAGLFGILLGAFGVHRFYLGYTAIGIVQIVVTIVTFGIGALWGFIEGILILTGTFNKDAKGNPLRE